MADKKIRFTEDEPKTLPEQKSRSPSARKVREESSQTLYRKGKFQTNRFQKIYGERSGPAGKDPVKAAVNKGAETAGKAGDDAGKTAGEARKAAGRKRAASFRRRAGIAGGTAAGVAVGKTNEAVGKYADDNAGSQALKAGTDMTEETVSTVIGAVSPGVHSRKLKFTGGDAELPENLKNSRTQSVTMRKTQSDTLSEAATKGTASMRKTHSNSSGKTPADTVAGVNPLSKRLQKRALQQEYAAARTGRLAGTAKTAGWHTKAFGRNIRNNRRIGGRVLAAVRTNPKALLITAAAIILLIAIVSASVTVASTVFQGTTNAVMASSYTATDRDIKKAEDAYRDLEDDLRAQIDRVKSDYPGYKNYEYDVAGIGHNPYELAALLTVLYEDYQAKDVEEKLKEILALQYDLKINGESPEEGSKTVRVGQSLGTVTTSGYCNCAICCGKWANGRTASGTVPKGNHTLAVDAKNPIVPLGTKVIMNGIEYTVEDTGAFAKYGVDFDVYYDSHAEASAHGHKTWEAYIADDNGTTEVTVRTGISGDTVTVTLDNRGIDYVAEHIGLTEDEKARYYLLKELKGNRPELFEDDIYANAGTGSGGYTIPTEALSDERFANMIREAEKYLGYPYVWGGSSPSTSFDCSGFVSYVINHCGNGWNYGRLTANGLYETTARVSKDEAQPGDLIFFQGTYKTSGASHVGIYVGNGRMIHCGNPIQYTSIETNYWQRHFLGFGRLP